MEPRRISALQQDQTGWIRWLPGWVTLRHYELSTIQINHLHASDSPFWFHLVPIHYCTIFDKLLSFSTRAAALCSPKAVQAAPLQVMAFTPPSGGFPWLKL